MIRTISIIAALVAALLISFLLGRGQAPGGGTSASGEREILYWVAPMDSSYRRDGPGKSPMGMDLVPVYADGAGGADDDSVVRIAPAVISSLGVRSAPAERGSLPQRIEATGIVGFDEDTLFHIHSRVAGWVEGLAVRSRGEPVQRGQKLFELYAPTLVSAQEEYLATLASGNATLQGASRDRLEALGVPKSEVERLRRERRVRQRISVFAESDGYVVELGVRDGVYVEPARKIMTVGALDAVWLTASVLQRQAALVSAGQRAELRFEHLPGQFFEGEVDYVYPQLDERTRTLPVRLRVANPDLALRPNMYATVTIFADDGEDVVHVPRQAVIRGGAHDRVVLDLGDGRFRSQVVSVGHESGDRLQVTEGLEAGERVVVSAQFLIDSESNVDAALARMEGGHEGMDHSHHDMSEMDHSGHDMSEMDHSGHDMSEMDHSGHDMNEMDHSGHDMPDEEQPR